VGTRGGGKRGVVAASGGREKNSGWRDVARSETHGGLGGEGKEGERASGGSGDFGGVGWASGGGRLAQKRETRDGAASTRTRKQKPPSGAGKGGRRIHLPRRETNYIRDDEEGKERGECTLENAKRQTGRDFFKEEERDLSAPDGKENVAVDSRRKRKTKNRRRDRWRDEDERKALQDRH